MKRTHLAILYGQILSYTLVVTFIFAEMTFNLTSVFRTDFTAITPQLAYVAGCLVALVGAINIWLTWYYISKSNTMRDWLVICAWTHRVKVGHRWVSMEDFLHLQLGYQVSHGLSDPALVDMRGELEQKWRQFRDRQERNMGATEDDEPPRPTEI